MTFHLKSQLASPDDSTKDASIPWPKSNEVVELGVLTIDKTVPDSLEAQKKLLFLPGQLIEGIEPSDDPLIGVRDGAYAVSFSRRNPWKRYFANRETDIRRSLYRSGPVEFHTGA